MSDVVILGIPILQDTHERYNLNTLHQVSGSAESKRPSDWVRRKSTQALIAELEKQVVNSPLDVVTGGNHAGTYAHELLAVSYAGWISPAFQLRVNQAFIDSRTQVPPSLPLPTAHDRLAVLKACAGALEDLGVLDDRDKIEFGAYIRQVAKAEMQPLTPASSATALPAGPTLWTLSMRLQALGYAPLTGPEQASMQIKLGSAAAKAYRQTYNDDPKKMWDYVKGQQRAVNAYLPERIGVIDDVIVAILGTPKANITLLPGGA